MVAHKHISARIAIHSGVALLALMAAPAFAQDAVAADGEPVAQDQAAGDGDIVVTARRREENLLDVPIAVTAYSGEALEQSGTLTRM